MNTKFYLVPANIMESNFPDDFENNDGVANLVTPIKAEEDIELKDIVALPASIVIQLREDQKTLNALKSAGVNNWEGYDDAMEFR